MRVTVHDLYTRRSEHLEGDEDQVEGQLGIMFPELAAEVDPDDGLEALVEHLDHRLQRYSVELSPFGELAKMQTAPKLPKLDRRGGGDVDLVSTGRQLDAKLALMHNASNLRSKLRPSLKRLDRQDYVDSRRTVRGMASSVSSPKGRIRIGYALSGHLRPSNPGMAPDRMGPLATAQHELFHQAMSRAVEDVDATYRVTARRYLARNLFDAIPKIHQPDVVFLQRTLAPHYEEGDSPHEERLARMLNYVNDPRERELFQQRAKMNPDRARSFDISIKRALKAVRAAAAQANSDWLMPLDWVKSEEDLEKSALLRPVSKSEGVSAGGVLPSDPPGGENLESGDVARDMLGFRPGADAAFAAAKFLAGSAVDPAPWYLRQATYDADGDAEGAALSAFGLEDSDQNRAALRSVAGLQALRKSGPDQFGLGAVLPGVPESQAVADRVARAAAEGEVTPLKLGGKHSAGSLLARCAGGSVLLKMGSGRNSPALGVQEEGASQSRREAAFYRVAELWGLGDWVPRADLVTVSGREFAAIELLPRDWVGAGKADRADRQRMPRVFHPLRQDGTLHRWAILDAALGNPDRHADNVMVGPDDQVALIDHGSAFAGVDFSPATDRNSFVPYYLRAATPAGKFGRMSPLERFHALPTLSEQVGQQVREWVDSLDVEGARRAMEEYGVDPAPSLARLARFRSSTGPIDAAVNAFWTLDEVPS